MTLCTVFITKVSWSSLLISRKSITFAALSTFLLARICLVSIAPTTITPRAAPAPAPIALPIPGATVPTAPATAAHDPMMPNASWGVTCLCSLPLLLLIRFLYLPSNLLKQ